MFLTDISGIMSDQSTQLIFVVIAGLALIRIILLAQKLSSIKILIEIVEIVLGVTAVIFLIVQPLIVKVFYIPSGSMRPTLVDQDHILVNRMVYRLHGPEHGDVVLFNAPPLALSLVGGPDAVNKPENYIKRLIGKPGDTIQVVGGTFTVNGLVYSHQEVRSFFGLPSDDDGMIKDHLKFETNDVAVFDGNKWTKYSPAEVGQLIVGYASANVKISPGYVIRNGQRLNEPYIAEDPDYNLKFTPDGKAVRTASDGGYTMVNSASLTEDQIVKDMAQPPAKIPPGKYVVMGDNRNESNDSSRWGVLDKDRFVGQAFSIFYPLGRCRVIH